MEQVRHALEWFDMQPLDERIQLFPKPPRPSTAPLRRRPDGTGEPYPEQVRKLLRARKAEKERMAWIDRLLGMGKVSSKQRENFVRYRMGTERNLTDIEEELGKIAVTVRRTAHGQRDDDEDSSSQRAPHGQRDHDEKISERTEPSGYNSQFGSVFAFANTGHKGSLTSADVGVGHDRWLKFRLDPDLDPEVILN